MPGQHRNHFRAEPHLRRPEPGKLIAPQQMPAKPQPPRGLRIPVAGRNEGINRVKQAGAEKLDVGTPVTFEEFGDVDDIAERLANAGVFEFFQQRAGKIHVEPGNVFVAFQHARGPVVAPEDLLRLPALGGVVQRDQVAQRLVHVQAQGVIHLRHYRNPPSVRTRKTTRPAAAR